MVAPNPPVSTTPPSNDPRFSLGHVVTTPGALEARGRNSQSGAAFVHRHEHGDWGEVGAEDAEANDDPLPRGS